MARKNKQSTSTTTTTTPAATTTNIRFPEISQKAHLNCDHLLEDQILLIHNFFSPQECRKYVEFIDRLPLALTPPKKRGEADRVNHRFSTISPSFAQTLHSLLVPHLPSLPAPASLKVPTNVDDPPARLPNIFNSNIRLYKYTPEQHFGPHYDEAVTDPWTGARSEWTLLVYLTGLEDGIEGGETVFYQERRGQPREVIAAPLTRGTALLHRHGHECLLHEGSPVRKGVKYVLRSDLMFMH